MIYSFKKYFQGRKQMPPFNDLKAFPHKDKYFYRTATWRWHSDSEITVVDPNAPRVITMDPWPQIIFLDATGNRTVAEYVEYMASKYSRQIPEELDQTIISMLGILIEEKIVAYSDTKVMLDPEVEKPKNAS
jgi:hypothetical protein